MERASRTDYSSFNNVIKRETGATVRVDYVLTIDTAKKVAMAEQTSRGDQVRDYFIACEKKAKQVSIVPDFSDPAAAARAWADTYEQRKLAEKQRDYAIATKAEIGDRREATAMNTASQFSKENQKLLGALGDSRTWKQVKAMDWLGDHFRLSIGIYGVVGKQLTKESKVLGYAIKRIPDSTYRRNNAMYQYLSPQEITDIEKEALEIIKAQSSRQRKVMYAVLYQEGKAGNIQAIKEFLDRTEGKISDKHQHSFVFEDILDEVIG